MVTKCDLNPLWDVAIGPSVIGEDQLPLPNKCHQNRLWDIVINPSVIERRSVTVGNQI